MSQSVKQHSEDTEPSLQELSGMGINKFLQDKNISNPYQKEAFIAVSKDFIVQAIARGHQVASMRISFDKANREKAEIAEAKLAAQKEKVSLWAETSQENYLIQSEKSLTANIPFTGIFVILFITVSVFFLIRLARKLDYSLLIKKSTVQKSNRLGVVISIFSLLVLGILCLFWLAETYKRDFFDTDELGGIIAIISVLSLLFGSLLVCGVVQKIKKWIDGV